MLPCGEPGGQTCGCGLSWGRRRVMGGLIAAAASGALSGKARAQVDIPPAQAALLSPAELEMVPALRPASPEAVALVRRIDVHHHPVPPWRR